MSDGILANDVLTQILRTLEACPCTMSDSHGCFVYSVYIIFGPGP